MAGKPKKAAPTPKPKATRTPKSVGSTPATTHTTPVPEYIPRSFPGGRPDPNFRHTNSTGNANTPQPGTREQGLRTKAAKDGTIKPVDPRKD